MVYVKPTIQSILVRTYHRHKTFLVTDENMGLCLYIYYIKDPLVTDQQPPIIPIY